MPPPPSGNAFNEHVKVLSDVTTELAQEKMKSAAHEEADKHGNECGVSVDGTWQKRGHTSLSGVVAALSINSGKVLDVEVLSRNCIGCKKHANDDKNSQGYLSWKADHESVCALNYTGSAPNMEPVGATKIFHRSIETRDLQYMQFLGDGDSKSYKAVVESNPYNGTSITKLECIGHYQKRLGTALRKLASDKKLGGKGKLTGKMIDKMQNYFGIALRNNTSSTEAMYKAIWATFFHLSSNINQPFHGKCPEGSNSWCSFQRAKANDQLNSYKHKPGLPIEIVRAIKPIYERLTSKEMLAKCLHGKTQNNNECFNGTVWRRCPKETYVGLTTLKFGVMDAVCHFNSGNKVELEVLKKMGIAPGKYTSAGVIAADRIRLRKSSLQSTIDRKQRRRYIRGRKKLTEDQRQQIEGPTYLAGGF